LREDKLLLAMDDTFQKKTKITILTISLLPEMQENCSFLDLVMK